jgi:hypothetical protein
MGRAHDGRWALCLDDRSAISNSPPSGSDYNKSSVELRTDLFTPPSLPGQQLRLF